MKETTVYLGRVTRGQVKAFIAFVISVTKEINSTFVPIFGPIYLTPLETNYAFDSISDSNNLTFTIQLPEIEDDNDEISKIAI